MFLQIIANEHNAVLQTATVTCYLRGYP